MIEDLERSNIKVVFNGKFNLSSHRWNLREHSHDYIEVIYFLDGRADIHVLKKCISAHTYDVIIYPVNTPHKEFVDLSFSQEVICLGIRTDIFDLTDIIHIVDYNKQFKWLIESIYGEVNDKCPEERLITYYVKALFLTVLKKKEEYYLPGSIEIRDAIEYIHNHFTNNISTEQLAEIAAISIASFINKFKVQLNTTPTKYINKLRIEAAKHLLCTTGMSIDEISNSVGYNSSKYFNRVFKSLTGMTPGYYRHGFNT